MEDNKEKVVTPTTEPKVTEIVTEENKGGSPAEPVVNVTKEEDGKVDYVKIRVDRGKKQERENILKDLGVEDLDKAKELIKDGQTALEEVRKLQAKLEAKEKETLENDKRNALVKLLDKENVFDSEALANYVDLDKVDITNGEIQDSENVIASLKKAKPNFFGKFQTISDNYIKGSQGPQKTALDKQKEGNTVGAINDYLKTILK